MHFFISPRCGQKVRQAPGPVPVWRDTTLSAVWLFFNYTGCVKGSWADCGVRHCRIERYDGINILDSASLVSCPCDPVRDAGADDAANSAVSRKGAAYDGFFPGGHSIRA
jgi:hypothetical protein